MDIETGYLSRSSVLTALDDDPIVLTPHEGTPDRRVAIDYDSRTEVWTIRADWNIVFEPVAGNWMTFKVAGPGTHLGDLV